MKDWGRTIVEEKGKIKVGDLVFPTVGAVKECPDLAGLWRGVTVLDIGTDGVAEVEQKIRHKIHIDKLALNGEKGVYDPGIGTYFYAP